MKLAVIFNMATKVLIFSINPSKVSISFNLDTFFQNALNSYLFFQNALNSDSGEIWKTGRSPANSPKSGEPFSLTPCSRPRRSSPMGLGLQKSGKKKKLASFGRNPAKFWDFRRNHCRGHFGKKKKKNQKCLNWKKLKL